MKKFLKKTLIYSLMMSMLMPTWLLAGIFNAKRAYAAASVSGGGGTALVNGSGTTISLNNLSINTTIDGDITQATGVVITLTNTTGSTLRFDTTASSVTAAPSGNLDLGSGIGNPIPITPTPTQITIPVNTVTSTMGDWLVVSDIKVKSTTAGVPGNENLRVTTASGTASGANILVDSQNPVIASGQTLDTNGNGRIDAIQLNFSKNIDDSTLTTGNFTLGLGYAISSIETGLFANDNVAKIDLIEQVIPDTGVKPMVTYTEGALRDLNGNPLISISVTPNDKAAPVMLYARTKTDTTLEITFSEDLNGASVLPADFTVSAPAHVVSAATELNGVVTLTLDLMSPSETPTITLAGSALIEDIEGNVALTGNFVTASNGVTAPFDPYLKNVTYLAGPNEASEQLKVGFSNQIGTVGANSDYVVEYDKTGLFTGSQRLIDLTALAAPVLDSIDSTKVTLTIPDQSTQLDAGGIFRVKVNGNVKDASLVGVDQITANANQATSAAITKFDSIPPVLTAVSIVSNGIDRTRAKIGDTITLTFTSNEIIQVPIVTINGVQATVIGSGKTWSAARTLGSSDAGGVVKFNISFSDIAGNIGTTATATTDNSSLTLDSVVTAPVVRPASPVRSSASVAPAAAQAQTPAVDEPQVTPAPGGDNQGVIKGEEAQNTTTDKINWTPWIILFVLILLTGAATGGYFYWFSGDEEVETTVKLAKTTAATKEKPRTSNNPKTVNKKPDNKSKRW